MAKSPALGPEIAVDTLDRGALPLFDRVAVAVVVPGAVRESVAGDNVANGTAPFPVSDIVWNMAGLPYPICSASDMEPDTEGLNITDTEQLLPGAILDPHVFAPMLND